MNAELSILTLRALRRVLRATETGSRNLAIATGLTPSQMLVLRAIDARDEPTPSAIASAVQFSQATITAIVDRLVGLDFATRRKSEKDRRRFILAVTPAGKRVLAAAPDPLQATFGDQFSRLPTWEQAMILASIEKIAMILGVEDLDAAPLLDSGEITRTEPD